MGENRKAKIDRLKRKLGWVRRGYRAATQAELMQAMTAQLRAEIKMDRKAGAMGRQTESGATS